MASSPSPSSRFSPLKRISHWLEGGLLYATMWGLGRLPRETASNLMGSIARACGPLLSQNRVARRNLHRAFPQWTEKQVEATLLGMWENMGRYYGELSHVAEMSRDTYRQITEIVGEEHYYAALASGKGSLFFSAHMGNWEWGAKAAWVLGTPFSIVYRPLNNPYAEATTTGIRNHYQTAGIPKTNAGGRELIATLKRGQPVAILIDQKMRSGIPIPFFGHDAPTSTALADMALKYDCPIVPTRVERIDTHRFRVTFEPPLAIAGKDAAAIMGDAHRVLERWISERPEQWFWVHKRWGERRI